MFTDMVGYTALGQRNESLSLALVEEQRSLLRPVIARHQGREVKTIGDAFLVEFTSAVEALRCAYDAQRAVKEFNLGLPDEKRIHIRVGIHLGEVVEKEGDILGDAVNIASRIQPLADDDGICVTQQVYDQVHSKVDLQLVSIGKKSLKNLSEAIEVYRMEMPWKKERISSTGLDNKRIAVLPFVNMSPDPNDEYFADGLTEELIDRLAQVKSLKVIARTSVMSYKGGKKKAGEIAKELEVGALVEGSVRKAANKVRVTVQLISASTEEHLWSSRYDSDLSDIFAIQTEIAENVTKELKVQLADSEKRNLESRPTANAEAYALYLKGRYYWNERTKPSVEKGLEYLREAIDVDPGFALAYSDLADAYVVMTDYGMLPTSEALKKVEEYASMALQLDSTLSQPHASLAIVQERNFNWADAEIAFERAIAKNPNNVTAHHWYALDLFLQGKVKAGIDEWSKARELDPLSLIIGSAFGYSLVRAGRKEEGLAMLKGVIELNDGFVVGHRNLAWAYLCLGMTTEALSEAKKLVSIEDRAENMVIVSIMNANAGLKEESAAILNRLLDGRGGSLVDPVGIAGIYASLGEEARAMEWLERAVNEKSSGVAYINGYPQFDALRSNPRFRELLRRVGFV